MQSLMKVGKKLLKLESENKGRTDGQMDTQTVRRVYLFVTGYKKHVSYFSSMYLHIIETYLYTILLVSKLLKCNKFFVIFIF